MQSLQDKIIYYPYPLKDIIAFSDTGFQSFFQFQASVSRETGMSGHEHPVSRETSLHCPAV
jgi:hypothetical protein